MSKPLKVLKRVWGPKNVKKTKKVLKLLYQIDIPLKKIHKSGLGKYVKNMKRDKDVGKYAKIVFSKWKQTYKNKKV